jgi:predicted amidohydrolase YtcJ
MPIDCVHVLPLSDVTTKGDHFQAEGERQCGQEQEVRRRKLTALGLQMIHEQAKRTPPGHWVRVVGGWSPYQFKERRGPTVAELNEAAPDTPVFVSLLYSRATVVK